MDRMGKKFGIAALIAVLVFAFIAVSAISSRMAYANSVPAFYAEMA